MFVNNVGVFFNKIMGIKIDEADRLFSLYIRTRDKWTCQRCGKINEQGNASLQNSHFYGRRMEAVRFDPENCDALCYGCHRYWEKEDREAYRQFKIKQLGQKGYDLLMLKAHSYHKKDRKMEAIKWKLALSELA